MTAVVTGLVSNGLVVPCVPLPEGVRVEIHVQEPVTEATRLSPSELRKLPPEQIDAILAKAAALAEWDYQNDKELTGFDAFSEECDDDSE